MSEWSQFGDRLAAGFRAVSERVFLIVSARDDSRIYVQFAGGSDAMDAEAPGAAVVEGIDEAVLAAAGWAAPSAGQPNWSFELPLPALTSEYAELAERCVVALRDVFGVTDPGQLVYRAWRDAEAFPQGVTLYPEQIEALDRGEDPLEIAQLGLPAAS
ncbi:TY-Chap domain-containing protein [Microbacterium murale]|uniref:TY-Chap N-terminal domain-containing protein n=1 Tax=Microbacterium murale TaxID=1081040 RepID=A0ABU0P589_9MICO|nr:hypothetical protein [Microbacterium murale]MDQ0642117.1 hypothetical protein [Microbacterium murale]